MSTIHVTSFRPSQYQPTASAAAGNRAHDHWVASPTP